MIFEALQLELTDSSFTVLLKMFLIHLQALRIWRKIGVRCNKSGAKADFRFIIYVSNSNIFEIQSDKSTLEYEKTRKKRPSGRPSGQSNNRRSDQSNGRISKSNRDSKPRSKTSKSRSPGGGRSSPKGHQVTI